MKTCERELEIGLPRCLVSRTRFAYAKLYLFIDASLTYDQNLDSRFPG